MRPTRFLFTCAIVCAAALFLNSGAKAQTPGSTELFDWTGFYIGGNVGGLSSNYSFSHFTDEVDIDAQSSQLPAESVKPLGPHLNAVSGDGEEPQFGFDSFSFPDNGITSNNGSNQALLGGGQAGYNKQFGHWVIGVEGDYQGTSASGKQLSTGFGETFITVGEINPPPPQGLNETITADTTLEAVRKAESDWAASLRARFGYAVGPFLFYGTAGVAWTELKVTATETASTDFFEDFDGGDFAGGVINAAANPRGGKGGSNFIGNVTSNNFSSSDNELLTGWTAGCGSQWAINDKVSVGVEYRHSDYGSHTFHFDSNEGVIFPGDTKVGLDTDQVTFRVNILISNFFGH